MSLAAMAPQGAADIQVFILSRDRPDYFRQALDSVLAQQLADGSFEVIVSDNSVGSEVAELVARDYPQVRMLRRQPCLPVLAHFNAVIRESAAEYLVMFHDDDVMFPGFLQSLRECLRAHPDLSAVACNAKIMQGELRTENTASVLGQVSVQVPDATALARIYLSYDGLGPLPFPGYMYRRKHVEGLQLESAEGGKYADVSFLMKVAARAPVLWLDAPWMWYRRHGSNDSARPSVPQLCRLLAYVYAHTGIGRRSKIVQQYRFRYLVRWWCLQGRGNLPWRKRIVVKFLAVQGSLFVLTHPLRCLRMLARRR